MNISEKQIRKRVQINLSIKETWHKWTTHEGLKSFFGRDNKIELTPGGSFEIYFILENPVGVRGSEGCKVLSFLPEKMLSFSWNAPPQFEKVRNSDYKTWVVVLFNEVSPEQTEISLSHLGWLADAEWEKVFEYFDKAWDMVLNGLKAQYNCSTT